MKFEKQVKANRYDAVKVPKSALGQYYCDDCNTPSRVLLKKQEYMIISLCDCGKIRTN